MIRIISGKYKGRNINTPLLGTEPTKNRVREAIFSAIYNEIPSSCVLDLFAGSGALGIEALSRGASICFFNDLSREACDIIKNNLSLLSINNCEVVNKGYVEALTYFSDKKFDIVLLDPPYVLKDSYMNVINYLVEKQMITSSSVIVLEYSQEILINETLFSEVRKYNYGKTNVMICRGLIK